jgi:microcystin-dependent protein
VDPFIGEIRMFAGNFAPIGWAQCDGAVLSIAQYDSLFSLLGTTYGGDGQSTFALPDLRGRLPLHAGPGPGLTARTLGLIGGAETVALGAAHLPGHTHTVAAAATTATSTSPGDAVWADGPNGPYYQGSATPVPMRAGAVATTGDGQPHDNVPPFTAVTFIIAVQGFFPSPS